MIWGLCGPSGAFSMISWLFVTQSGHDAYQIKAEYPRYSMISLILLLIGNLKI